MNNLMVINRIWTAVAMAASDTDPCVYDKWCKATEIATQSEREHRGGLFNRVYAAPRGFSAETAGRYHVCHWFLEACAQNVRLRNIRRLSGSQPVADVGVNTIIEHKLESTLAEAVALYLCKLNVEINVYVADLVFFNGINYVEIMDTPMRATS